MAEWMRPCLSAMITTNQYWVILKAQEAYHNLKFGMRSFPYPPNDGDIKSHCFEFCNFWEGVGGRGELLDFWPLWVSCI